MVRGMKRATVIRHVKNEGIAGYRAPIEAAGYAIEALPICTADFATVDLIAPDLLVVMGGPMGVYEADRFPWITLEVAAIRKRLEANRPTLGVCLGSQMIAAALGERVYPGAAREVGFSKLTLNAAGKASPLAAVDGVEVLHWHGDTFDLPAGCELLASTPLFERQAFRRGREVLALQFHAEMGEDPRYFEWLRDEPDYIQGAGTSPETLADQHERFGKPAVVAGRAMIADWLAGLR